MTRRQSLERAADALRKAGVADADTDARLLFAHVTGLSGGAYYLHRDEEMGAEAQERFSSLVKRRATRIPLQHLTGEAWFCGHRFLVNPDVLIPRFDTEILVEEAAKLLRPEMRVLDLCTGSGCVLISLLLDCSAAGVGADISPLALVTAEKNAQMLGVQASWVESDLFSAIPDSFDLIVSNPPYIAAGVIGSLEPEVRDHDPRIALDGGADGLDIIRRIVEQSREHLPEGGSLLLEIGSDQGTAVRDVFESCGYSGVRVVRDLAGLDRVVCGRRQ